MKEVMKSEIPDDVSVEDIDAHLEIPRLGKPHDIHHLQRMLYISSLVAPRAGAWIETIVIGPIYLKKFLGVFRYV